ncbi:hypothetical protein HMN09_00251500 [Mycena chlorophos]|uniref:polynucleotide adenylyltransferase n=1 Tax=Mycena chlorophos TaxID=658473 RepID=A0A8H6TM24_MYCCL|nr:hypothetical protein HMN09_00251500 [Mycena chlorophos]
MSTLASATMTTDIPSRRRPQRPKSEHSTKSVVSGGFDDGTEFIPLDDSQDREKGKARDDLGERERDKHRPRSRSPPAKRRRRSRSRSAEGRRDDADEHRSTREWDRGKRKYDMVFDFNEAAETSKRRRMERFTPWVEGVDWVGCKSVAELFHREIEGFVHWISPTPQEDEIRGLVVEIISRCVTQRFPDAQVLPFGSYATKLYLPSGDLDLVIRSESMAYSPPQVVLSTLATILRRSGLTDGKVTVIAKARVPIVKFVTSAEYGHFNVDISINQESGLASGQIINNFLQDFGSGGTAGLALRALVLLTKLFLTQRQMNEVYTGGLGSYAVVCLCISFLQMHPKIRFGHIDPDRNLGVLVLEFFELYGHRFHYDEVGISLRNGGCYFGKRQRGWGDYGVGNRRASNLSIEDPGDPSNDISSGSYNFHNVRQNLAGAHDILIAAVYTKAGILSARKGGHATLLRDRYDPKDVSILGAMLGVDQKTINDRRLVKEVYDSRALHKLVGVEPRILNEPEPQLPSSSQPQLDLSSVAAHAENGDSEDGKSPKKKRKRKSKSKSASKAQTPVPVPVVAHDDTREGPSRTESQSRDVSRAASVVKDAWMAAAAAEQDDAAVVVNGTDDEEEEGRYGVGQRSLAKNRKPRAPLVVYMDADSAESDDPGLGDGHKRNLAERQTEREGSPPLSPRKGLGARMSSTSSLDPAQRRDYWLSKGIGHGPGSASASGSDE